MKTLNLKLAGLTTKIKPIVAIDGQNVVCKRNKFGNYDISYQTEKDELEVVVTRELELKARLWWLYAFISFIVSVFGIFEPYYDKKCIDVDLRFKVKLYEETNVKLNFNLPTPQGRVAEFETQNEVEELKNEFQVSTVVKRRWKILLALKLLTWVAIIVVAIVLIARI